MKVHEIGLPGLFVLEPKVFQDERGFFLESYNRESFRKLGIDCEFVQDNHAYSRDVGVLRGFHFQLPPAAQAKLVWVSRGEALDVVIDLRKGSPMYGEVRQILLNAANFKRVFIPKGFGHAYVTTMPDTEFQYKVDAPYAPELEGGIAWNDPDIAMDWGHALDGRPPILSDKDRKLAKLADFDSPFIYEEN